MKSFFQDINELIPAHLLLDERTRGWWSCVFTGRTDALQYDAYYDTLRVSEDSQMTFGQLLEGIERALRSLTVKTLSVNGQWTECLPLRYVCQRVGPGLGIEVEWTSGTILHLSTGDILLPKDAPPVTVHVPMHPEVLSSLATETRTWGDIVGNAPADYHVGSLPFRVVEIGGELKIKN